MKLHGTRVLIAGAALASCATGLLKQTLKTILRRLTSINETPLADR